MRPIALFDLDGTLTDPEEGIVNCILHAFDALGRTPPERADLRSWIGPPLRDSFMAALDANGEAADRALAAYRERFVDQGMLENRLIPGIEAALGILAESGVRLFVATSKPAVFAEPITRHLGIGDRFEAVYGSELDGTRGHKPELLAHILASEGLDAADVVMIGDRHHDIAGALANRVASIGVTWGFGSRRELTDAGADQVIDRVDELTALWTAGKTELRR